METPPEDMYIVTPSDMAESDITFVPASRADALSVAPGGPQFAVAGNGSPPNNEPRKIKTLPVRGDQSVAAAPVTWAKTSPSVWLAPPSPSIAPVAQRVVLYDEDPADPKGKQYIGSVIWRTEPIKASGNQKPDIAVRADIEIPDRKMKMTMSFLGNTEHRFPQATPRS